MGDVTIYLTCSWPCFVAGRLSLELNLYTIVVIELLPCFDCGCCATPQFLSQYPGEAEYLMQPLSCIEVSQISLTTVLTSQALLTSNFLRHTSHFDWLTEAAFAIICGGRSEAHLASTAATKERCDAQMCM